MLGSDPVAPATQGILKTSEGWFSGWILLPHPMDKEGQTEDWPKVGLTPEPNSEKRVLDLRERSLCLGAWGLCTHGVAAVCLKRKKPQLSCRDPREIKRVVLDSVTSTPQCTHQPKPRGNPLILALFHRSRRMRSPPRHRPLGRGVRLFRLGSLGRGRTPIKRQDIYIYVYMYIHTYPHIYMTK